MLLLSNTLDNLKTEFGKRLIHQQVKNASNIKFKSRIPALIRKHLFRKKSKLDIFYVTGVINMEQKILNMFNGQPGTSDSCLGLRYASNGANIWSMQYQNVVMQRLFGK